MELSCYVQLHFYLGRAYLLFGVCLAELWLDDQRVCLAGRSCCAESFSRNLHVVYSEFAAESSVLTSSMSRRCQPLYRVFFSLFTASLSRGI